MLLYRQKDVAHDGDPFKEKEHTSAEAKNGVIAEDFDGEDIAGFDGYEDDEDVPFPEVEGDDDYEIDFDDDMEDDGFIDDYKDEDEWSDDYLEENKLNDFGKHPAYSKKPMTLPPNREVAPNGARDWNDETVEGEEPFGQRIGSSAPFEKSVQKITNSVMESLGF